MLHGNYDVWSVGLEKRDLIILVSRVKGHQVLFDLAVPPVLPVWSVGEVHADDVQKEQGPHTCGFESVVNRSVVGVRPIRKDLEVQLEFKLGSMGATEAVRTKVDASS